MKKRIIALGLGIALIGSILAGCTTNTASNTISVISREDGSGTRSAFIELFGIEEKDASGNKVDNTTPNAETINSTSVMMTTVAGNKNAIGYISLGSLNDTVKALKVDGVEATADNIKNGTYKISRPFNIATKGELDAATADFIAFIMSEDGQKVVEEKGYISSSNTGKYTAKNVSGKIKISGSSSVTPAMEALKEAYVKLNPQVTIELQQSDSTTGMNDVINGVSNIGMASREVKDSELQKGLKAQVIALDGIAVIVNNENALDNIAKDTVKDIYTEQITTWDQVK